MVALTTRSSRYSAVADVGVCRPFEPFVSLYLWVFPLIAFDFMKLESRIALY